MPQIELETLLGLVGTLDDSTDPGSASARFRDYLRGSVQQVGDVRIAVFRGQSERQFYGQVVLHAPGKDGPLEGRPGF
jgi:hypothetical protein